MKGKQMRLRRLFADDLKMVMIPMDHGITIGPVKGIENINKAVSDVSEAGVDSVVLHKGMASSLNNINSKTSLVIHVSASTELGPDPLRKVQVCTVEEAIRLGADAVSTHVNFGSEYEFEQMMDTAAIAKECDRWGIPLLVMAYVRGAKVDEFNSRNLAHAVRISAELGADIVKTSYSGSAESFQDVVSASSLPVLIAGGGKVNDELALFQTIQSAMEAGSAGISIGRNVFGHDMPQEIVRQLLRIVHESVSAEQAYNDLPQVLQEVKQ